MIIEIEPDHYKVVLNCVVTVGKVSPLDNFQQFLQDLYKEFNQDLSRTLFQIVKLSDNLKT